MNNKYFPHANNARHERAVLRVRKELGAEGYAIYFMLLEVLMNEEGYKYPVSDIDLLEMDFQVSKEKIGTVITKYSLFEVNQENFFLSPSLIESLEPYEASKHRNRISGIKGNLIRYGYCSKEEVKGMTDAQVIEAYEASKLATKQNIRALSRGESGAVADASQLNKIKEDKIRLEKRREEKRRLSKGAKAPAFPSFEEFEKDFTSNEKYLCFDALKVYEALKGYCEAQGKKYKSYTAAAQNWCRRSPNEFKKESIERGSLAASLLSEIEKEL
jgi:hypothetical protein